MNLKSKWKTKVLFIYTYYTWIVSSVDWRAVCFSITLVKWPSFWFWSCAKSSVEKFVSIFELLLKEIVSLDCYIHNNVRLRAVQTAADSQAALLGEIDRLRDKRGYGTLADRYSSENLWKGALVSVRISMVGRGSPDDLAMIYGNQDEVCEYHIAHRRVSSILSK